MGGPSQEIIPLRGSILQAETCQILSLAENPRWSPSVTISILTIATTTTTTTTTTSLRQQQEQQQQPYTKLVQFRPILSQSRTLSIREPFPPGTVWKVKLLKQEHTRASNLNSKHRLFLKRTPTCCSHTHTWGFLQLFIQIQIQMVDIPQEWSRWLYQNQSNRSTCLLHQII